ncbi:MAG: metallophosphoesterase [Actinomycetota bacterium]
MTDTGATTQDPTSSEAITVAQLSDTHFLEADAEPEGGYAYDTADAFDAVQQHLEANHQPDLIVVTGDIADHGRPAQYRRAADAFARFTAPVNVCPGNHDQDVAFTAGVGRPGVGTSQVVEAGPWCFLFVDSNAGVMVPDESGRLVDPPDYGDRLHRNGALGERQAHWVRDACAATAADHVFVWLHHPPTPRGYMSDEAYAAEWQALLADLPEIRGFGAGHTHIPTDYTFDDRPVFVSPALKHNFDLEAETWLPPGYRSYRFRADGAIDGAVHLVDEDRWPRRPIGRALAALLRGELSFEEFDAIVARKRAEAAN